MTESQDAVEARPSTPGPAEPRPARPRLVTAAFAVVLAAAAVNAVIGVLVLVQLPAASRAATAQVDQATAAGAVALLSVVAAAAFVYAAALVVFAAVFRSGRPWGRVALFATSLLSLFALLVPNLPALIVVALLVVADVLMYRSPVTVWVRSLRGLGRA